MIRLVVSVVCVNPFTGRDVTLAAIESFRFDHEHVESDVGVALEAARIAAKVADLGSLQIWKPEVGISLTTGDERLRPALHFGRQTLGLLYTAGASVDFDPYV